MQITWLYNASFSNELDKSVVTIMPLLFSFIFFIKYPSPSPKEKHSPPPKKKQRQKAKKKPKQTKTHKTIMCNAL